MRESLKGRVKNTSLPTSKPLMPVFEAVVNSLQAIQEAGDVVNPTIRVEAMREGSLDAQAKGSYEAFAITDNGVGFTERNLESFNTADSLYKLKKGGKGVGRFTWLKAFSRVEIDSHYNEGGGLRHRKFEFVASDDEPVASFEESSLGQRLTTVKLVNFQPPYKRSCPKDLDIVAQRLIEHFLSHLVNPDCPEIVLFDDEKHIVINDLFRRHFQEAASRHEFQVNGALFSLSGFRMFDASDGKHRLIYAADNRSVKTEGLDKHLPNLKAKLEEAEKGSFTYIALVEGEHLDRHVNNERTEFSFPTSEPDEAETEEQLHLLAGELSLPLIRAEAVKKVADDLKPFLDEINTAKRQAIETYISTEAPEYRILSRYVDEFIDAVPPNPDSKRLEASLHEQVYLRQRALREESHKIIEEAAHLDQPGDYETRLRDYMERSNELGKAQLANYVVHRKVIIDILAKTLSKDPETGKFALEKAIHNIVFPMRTTSDTVSQKHQNLWIIDERLSFHHFLASDIRLSSLPVIENGSDSRPDIVIFDRPLVFSEDDSPLSSVVVIEFKRPMRDGYGDEDPIEQVYAQIMDIRDGRFKDGGGRYVRVSSQQLPAYAYVVCDLTPEIERMALMKGLLRTPDNMGFFGYNPNINTYVEVISFDKLLSDAKKRNRILFEMLNIPT
jgi:hypothetical protein